MYVFVIIIIIIVIFYLFICEGPTADELCSVGWCINVFNLDCTHLCLDIPVPPINKNFIIIIIIIRKHHYLFKIFYIEKISKRKLEDRPSNSALTDI